MAAARSAAAESVWGRENEVDDTVVLSSRIKTGEAEARSAKASTTGKEAEVNIMIDGRLELERRRTQSVPNRY